MSQGDDFVTNRTDWRELWARVRGLASHWCDTHLDLNGLSQRWQPMRKKIDTQWQAVRADAGERWARWRASLPEHQILQSRAHAVLVAVRRHPALPRVAMAVAAIVLVGATAKIVSDRAERSNERAVLAERHRADELRQRSSEIDAKYATERQLWSETEVRHVIALAAEQRRSAEAQVTHAVELAELRRQVAELRDQIVKANLNLAGRSQELVKANEAIAALKAKLANRRLSYEEKRALIAALGPHHGQRISVAAIYGDDEARTYAEDLVQVLEASGWKTNGSVAFERWDRTPVGLEVTLNEADARAGRLSAGVGALINVARRMGLVDGNTVFMNRDVPTGEVQLRVGHRLQAAAAPQSP